MRAERIRRALSRYRSTLGGALVVSGLLVAFAILTILEFSPATDYLSFDIYLLTSTVLIVASCAFFQLQTYNKQQSQILSMQLKENAAMRGALDTHAIVSVTNSAGEIIDVNERFAETFGYSRHECIGRTPHFLYDGKDGTRVFLEIREKISKGISWSGEHSAVMKSGERRWFQATIVPITDKSGRLIKAISIRSDVTSLRAAAADRQVRGLLDNLQDEVYIYRLTDLSITYMNNSACQRHGWTQDEALRRRILDIDPQLDEARIRERLAPLVRGDVETTFSLTNESETPTEISTRLFEQANGEMVFISLVRDVTERQALARAKLSSVSMVSHELRTPLTSIAGALKMLEGRFTSDLTSQAGELLKIAARNTDRLLFIVNDILDLEKIEAGQMRFEKEHIDLDVLIRDAVVSHQTYASGLKVGLAYSSDRSGAMIEGDPARLMQVMANLISNAAKYSYEGDVVDVSVTDHGTAWRVAVRDRGPGISEDGIKKLFDTFAQLQAADGVRREGTGLGLAITKRILDKHSASIHVESRLGEGSCFYFDMPKAQMQALETDKAA
ncbi:PAS/PAC sensor signal transduction histidine kinase [Roseivivax lentus]|uniref:histidine kinase n=1 Tax=Roseivivax lentus TaxID=633194 RepID=A0A1N7P6R9_9RHOB|nr:PAS domain-containing sensor histidine kinase [Roseivivax lentus]SIT06139.1 PAS/PAC sensor signal transduction histidine kinase [Roseivivax lentus]